MELASLNGQEQLTLRHVICMHCCSLLTMMLCRSLWHHHPGRFVLQHDVVPLRWGGQLGIKCASNGINACRVVWVPGPQVAATDLQRNSTCPGSEVGLSPA